MQTTKKFSCCKRKHITYQTAHFLRVNTNKFKIVLLNETQLNSLTNAINLFYKKTTLENDLILIRSIRMLKENTKFIRGRVQIKLKPISNIEVHKTVLYSNK